MHARTKHIELQHHFIREATQAGKVQVEYIPTGAQLADFLTKPLPNQSFVANRYKAGVIPFPFSIEQYPNPRSHPETVYAPTLGSSNYLSIAPAA